MEPAHEAEQQEVERHQNPAQKAAEQEHLQDEEERMLPGGLGGGEQARVDAREEPHQRQVQENMGDAVAGPDQETGNLAPGATETHEPADDDQAEEDAHPAC